MKLTLFTFHYFHFPLFLALYLLQGPDNSVHTRVLVDIVNVDILYDTLLVDNKNSPFGDTFRPENVVFE